MSLASRASAFFLGVLAVALIGFTLTICLLARAYLYQQVEERVQAALDTVTATIETKPGVLEWEPEERHLTLGSDAGEDQIRWLLRDGQGNTVAHSPNYQGAELDADRWRILTWRMQAMPGEPSAKSSDPPRPGHEFQVLEISCALSLEPTRRLERTLWFATVGTSVTLWLAAALAGGWLCRRALKPLTSMATAAREMTGADLSQRLPAPGTRDELEDLHGAFNDLLTRVQEAFVRQQRFTGEASHQLRTPLTALLGQLEVGLRREREPAEYRQILERAHRGGLQLVQIVEMLLFLARADAEAALPNLEAVDLRSWLQQHLESWANHSRRADLQVSIEGYGPFTIPCHPAMLGQLLDNLLENACKYSSPGNVIAIKLERVGDEAQIEVADRGTGIPREDLDHIFEPFYRSARARQQGLPGAGLGLAVAQRIAKALGGSISVSSELGIGSRFVIRLPAKAV